MKTVLCGGLGRRHGGGRGRVRNVSGRIQASRPRFKRMIKTGKRAIDRMCNW